MSETLYQELRREGIPTSNHESDLYFPCTDQTREIVRRRVAAGELLSRPGTFLNQVDGTPWYDAPFQFDPFWEKVARVSQ